MAPNINTVPVITRAMALWSGHGEQADPTGSICRSTSLAAERAWQVLCDAHLYELRSIRDQRLTCMGGSHFVPASMSVKSLNVLT